MTGVRQGVQPEAEGSVGTITPTIRDIDIAVYEKFGKMCAEFGIHRRLGFKKAVEAWEKCENATSILALPPFDKLGETVKEEFRRRCAENKLTPEAALMDAIIVWLRNFAFMDPPHLKKVKTRRVKEKSMGLPV